MSNLQNITSKIINDAEVQKDSILAQANQKSELIINKKKSAADKDAADLIEKSKKEADKRYARVLSSANLKIRNDKLVAKQSVINDIFEKAKNKLNSMSEDDFKKFILDRTLASDISGDENLIVSKDKKSEITQEFIKNLNSKLIEKGRKGEIKLSDEDGSFNGGFILEKDGIEINNTFESLVDSLRDEMEFDIANILFN